MAMAGPHRTAILVSQSVLFAFVIVVVPIGLSKILDLSDGLGYGIGETEGWRQLHQAKDRLRFGQPYMAAKQALTGIRLLATSEIRSNLAQPHLQHSRLLYQQGKHEEAYTVCLKALEQMRLDTGYTYDTGKIQGECNEIRLACWQDEE